MKKQIIKICSEIGKKSIDEVISVLEKHEKATSLTEIRLDYLKNLNLSCLQQIFYKSKKQLLITLRTKKAGGKSRINDKQRTKILLECIGKADYIDVDEEMELKYKNQIITEAKKTKTKIIISSHNFKNTPSLEDLKKKFDKLSQSHADIVKIVTYAQSADDNIKSFQLIRYGHLLNKSCVILTMGELANANRLVSPLFGNYLIYAALKKGEELAPGQLTVDEYKQIFKITNTNYA